MLAVLQLFGEIYMVSGLNGALFLIPPQLVKQYDVYGTMGQNPLDNAHVHYTKSS